MKYVFPKPIVINDIPFKPQQKGQKEAVVSACISMYSSSLQYFCVSVDSKDYRFLTLEEAMVFCDINDYFVDTCNWTDPNVGINKFYTIANRVELYNGKTIKIDD